MMILLKKAMIQKIIHPIDFYFATFISKTNPIIMLISACVSYENRNGHIFLPIEYFEKNSFFSSLNLKFIKKILIQLGKNPKWILELSKCKAVSNGTIPTPLVLFQKKIYLYKMWKAEDNILNYLYENNVSHAINISKCAKILKNLFCDNDKNIQKIAVALSLIRNVIFITGGPGTGKTTTIYKIIVALIKISNKKIKIQLSAPTGKATENLTKNLNNSVFNTFLNSEEKNNVIKNAITLHKLLGIQKISQKKFFNEKNKLDIDVLIIDEASMIDVLMMESILLALKKNTKVIFVGDYNQLSPIETGAILKNICYYSNEGYHNQTLSLLEKITNCKLSFKKNEKKTAFISDNICTLTDNYRFKKSSNINILADAIYKNDKKIIQNLFKNLIKNVYFYEVNHDQDYEKMMEFIFLNYLDYWNIIQKKVNIKEIIKSFQKNQILCILKNGLFGTRNLNKKLEEILNRKKIIKCFSIKNKLWYVGKPIMIVENNRSFGLSNGDIGISNMNSKGILQVSFLLKNQKIINIPAQILNNYQTAWAITVHKSQGSEFSNIILVLPNDDLEILKKDILYTAVTRSREKIFIFSKKKIFKMAILKKTKKENSLIKKINILNKIHETKT
ncbi:exodeoxyribonuclease V subunit alpha [Buchnera aphidicola (Muscaphis stroyani)]|uniref:RecBCD enzyme subunit RecD n=1 Tax=Buchnera aphidicola (Muscaphis stroyani) TaxID=1241869 RepID=A0A4D6Y5R8_9GAMM|nr:exodeoxyribonuclease V subunit alpha [Buchnera aphidicola]QCI24499.1 exodeoxyribonuclease V subunit alpha [Buchnera aphidicola (Muscaphis stroyani)]